MRKRVTIFGSTGSVGENALRVIAEHRDAFEVVGLAARSNTARLTEQARTFRPRRVAVWEPTRAAALRTMLTGTGVEVLDGAEIDEIVRTYGGANGTAALSVAGAAARA